MVEQRAHIRLRHVRHVGGAKPHQANQRAMPVFRVGVARLAIGGDGALAVAELLADFAEREPGRGIAGHEFQRLFEQVRGAAQIALGLASARPFEAAVRDEVPRRQ